VSVFEENGMAVVIDDSEPNIYRININFEDQFVIDYTWTIISETLIEGEVEQDISLPSIGDCNVYLPIRIEYTG